MAKKTKTLECVLHVKMRLDMGCLAGKTHAINEIARDTGLCWETTRDCLNLLEALGVAQKVGVGGRMRWKSIYPLTTPTTNRKVQDQLFKEFGLLDAPRAGG